MADETVEKKDPNWMQNLWRPMMGWMYMVICMLDMAIFPVLWSLLQAMMHVPITQWNPLTLQGAGLFHIAMGAVLGISAFGRTQEKLAGTAANPTTTATTSGGFGNGNSATPAAGFAGGAPAFGAPSAGSFGSTSNFGTTAPGFGAVPPASTGFSSGGFGSVPSATPVTGTAMVSKPMSKGPLDSDVMPPRE